MLIGVWFNISQFFQLNIRKVQFWSLQKKRRYVLKLITRIFSSFLCCLFHNLIYFSKKIKISNITNFDGLLVAINHQTIVYIVVQSLHNNFADFFSVLRNAPNFILIIDEWMLNKKIDRRKSLNRLIRRNRVYWTKWPNRKIKSVQIEEWTEFNCRSIEELTDNW